MKTDIYYVIDGTKTTDEKEDAKHALKSGAKLLKVVRIEYQTRPTKSILATMTEIFKSKDI